MQRQSYNSVSPRYRRSETDVPILVPSEQRHPDGYGPGLVPIRVLGPGDFDLLAFQGLGKKAKTRLRELIALRQGIAGEEEPSYWLSRFLTQRREEAKLSAKVKRALDRDISKSGRPSAGTKRLIGAAQLRFGDPLAYLSHAFSAKLSGARLVLWWKGQPRFFAGEISPTELAQRVWHVLYWRKEQFVPAIFCPDMETAFYVYALFRATGRGFGICPECGDVFQKVRTDSLYCCFSHAEAFRVRRWRAEQQRKAAKEAKAK